MPIEKKVRTILNKTKRRDPWFLDDYTVNPYSGCSFNCLYCYIRGSKYGEQVEDKLAIKTNALELLDKELAARARKGQYGIIVLSSATDPYLQFEREQRLTRGCLALILKHRFPVHVITKSDLVLRDMDILTAISETAILPAELADKLPKKAIISFSFSTMDNETGRIFEPGAPSPEIRLNTLKTVLRQGFLAGVSLMPLLPYISDTKKNLDDMFSIFKGVGVKYVFPAGLGLYGSGPSDSRTLFFRAIAKHYPALLPKYERLYGGDPAFSAYYQKALVAKLKELCSTYSLQDRICYI